MVDEHLPLTEATLFILLSLANGGKHGYAILQDVAELSQQRVVLGTGTLYGALKRLLEQGWIVRIESTEPDTETGRPRKDYDLSELGRRILSAEVARLTTISTVAHRRLQGGLTG